MAMDMGIMVTDMEKVIMDINRSAMKTKGARSCVFKDVEAWTVVGGNPAKEIKKRTLKSE